MQSWLKEKIAAHVPGTEFEIHIPPDPALGDYATNVAFICAKAEHKSPLDVAHDIISRLKQDTDIAEKFGNIQAAAPGFINFFFKPEFLQKKFATLSAQREKLGTSSDGVGKTVIVESSSPNIAKAMHIGHLRSTIIGDALANMFALRGYRVIRWNYLGDWGTQFGKLIAAYKLWGNKEELAADPIGAMQKLYVRFHDEMKNNPDLEKRGQEEFKKLESGDGENRHLWTWFRDESLQEFQKIYDILGVQFDVMKGESDYEKDLSPLIDDLKKRNLVRESEGALIAEPDGLPPAIVQKSDQATLYFTRDLATLHERLTEYYPDVILYVVANQQALHFEQLFSFARKKLGWDSAQLAHIKFGMVLGSDRKKLATREGNAIALEDVIEEVTERTRKIIQKKNPELSEKEKEEVAEIVGIGALKYNDLKEFRTSDIVFDWDRMLDLTGNSGPYLQYTYARLRSIWRKAGWMDKLFFRPDATELTDTLELALIKHLLNFSDAIALGMRQYATSGVALYLYELANLASRYYETVRILSDDNRGRRHARLALIGTVATVLKQGLGILGMQTLEEI